MQPVLAEIARLEAHAAPDCEVHRDAWRAVLAFLALQTQWRVQLALGGVLWLGLDYAGVRAWLELQGHAPRTARALLADLQVMERAALPVLNATKVAVATNAAKADDGRT